VSDKPLAWLGTASRRSRLSGGCTPSIGFQLRRVEHGLDPDDWKPMTSVGPGVRQIRIRTDVAFVKRTRTTAKHDVQLARDRYRALVKKRADDAKET
jgi:phage-related protein